MPGGKAGYRAGIPQQPYTKWDTDKDEVEVDYKQLDDKHASWFSGRKGIVLRILIILVIFSLGLIIGYIIRRSVHELILRPDYNCPVTNGYEGYNADVSSELRDFIDPASMEANLKLYTKEVHPAGVHNNNELRELLKQQLRDYKVKVKEARYEVLLSFANLLDPNAILLLNGSGEVQQTLQYEGPHPKFHPEWAAYNAYSPNMTVEGHLVYANFGEKRDFDLLRERGVDCEGNIVIMRYGNIYRGEKVSNAEACGAVGVILYSDPADVQGFLTQPHEVFPNSWWLPGWAVQRGTIIRDNPGDPLTPGLPATDGMYRLPEHEAKLPTIPVQPISHDAAHQLLLYMRGPEGPTRWKGSMHGNISYQLGPGYEGVREDWRIRLEVHNERVKKVITNVFGIIEGFEEPDRYVIVGSHYDAWLYGAVDPNSGTAVLMELAKAFANLTTKGWRPRRSIIFAHWDAEEQGLHGSYEWVEENGQELSERTVAYINLDAAVMGNYTLWMEATPPLRTLIKAVSHMITPATSSADEIAATSLYDEWARRSPSDDDLSIPLIQDMGSGSDHAPFLFTLGIPSMWPSYVFDTTAMHQRFYPGFHTAIDNFTMVKDFIDPDFQAHRAIAELVAEVTLQLASHTKLPMDCREFATTLGSEFNELKAAILYDENYENPTNKPANHVLDHLQFAVGNFTTVANNFMEYFGTVSNKDVLELRRSNDKLIQLSRAFIHPEGLPGRPHLKNILYAPSAADNYAPSTFTAIRDAFDNYDKDKTHQNLQQLEIQISIATHSVQKAISILTDSIIT